MRISWSDGIYTWPQSQSWKPEGQWSFVSSELTYNWDFKNGTFDWKGTIQYTDGSHYSGEFKDGVYHWKGLFSSQKETYSWYFVDGVRSGTWRIALNDGTIYQGNFENDQYHGEWILIWNDGSFSKGNFENNQPIGVHKVYTATTKKFEEISYAPSFSAHNPSPTSKEIKQKQKLQQLQKTIQSIQDEVKQQNQ